MAEHNEPVHLVFDDDSFETLRCDCRRAREAFLELDARRKES